MIDISWVTQNWDIKHASLILAIFLVFLLQPKQQKFRDKPGSDNPPGRLEDGCRKEGHPLCPLYFCFWGRLDITVQTPPDIWPCLESSLHCGWSWWGWSTPQIWHLRIKTFRKKVVNLYPFLFKGMLTKRCHTNLLSLALRTTLLVSSSSSLRSNDLWKQYRCVRFL